MRIGWTIRWQARSHKTLSSQGGRTKSSLFMTREIGPRMLARISKRTTEEMIVREAKPHDAAVIAKVHVDSWRSTYSGMISDDFLEGLSYAEREQMWNTALTSPSANNHVYVIESDEGEVVGFVAAGVEREKPTGEVGEIYALYLLEHYQGRGWGKQLFLQAAERLKREGCLSLMLWVLAHNPTRGFYESLGGVVSREKDIEIGGDTLVEIAYEWKRIDSLLK